MEQIEVVMGLDRETKGTHRFANADHDAVQTIYIRKPHAEGVKKIRVTIEEVEEAS